MSRPSSRAPSKVVATPIPNNEAEFSLEDLVRITGGHAVGATTGVYRGVCTDTRTLRHGAVFVALSGERFDGHQFVERAHQAGAALAIVERELPLPVAQLVVGDALVALGRLASHHRRRWGGQIVAIAGAAGKTTTRATTSAILEAAYGAEVHSTPGNLNNQVGVPMVLLGLLPQHRFAVVEVGTNQTGEVPLITAMVQPDVSVLTLVDFEHSEGLGGLDEIEAEEGAIFGASCHTLVVNGDDERALRQAHAARARAAAAGNAPVVVSYGFSREATLRVAATQSVGVNGTRLLVADTSGQRSLSVPIVGRPACYAALAAIAASEALTQRTFTQDELQSGLDSPSLKPEGRAELVSGPGGTLILNDSYNANPASMRAAIVTASELAAERGGRLHLVLGEMRELGQIAAPAHAALGDFVVGFEWSSLFAIGREMGALVARVKAAPSQRLTHGMDTAGVAEALLPRLQPADVILVKGSRGVRTEMVIAELRSQKVDL